VINAARLAVWAGCAGRYYIGKNLSFLILNPTAFNQKKAPDSEGIRRLVEPREGKIL